MQVYAKILVFLHKQLYTIPMKCGFYVKKADMHCMECAEKFFSFFSQRKVCCYYVENSVSDDTDFLLVFGGDGTMLRACSLIMGKKVSILGINFGRLGFLTELTSEANPEVVFQRLSSGDYNLENRSTIKINYNTAFYTALNDVVISRSDNINVVKVLVSDGKDTIQNFYGDGIIFSTPTGSTAYTLSAGGPIISPNLEAVAITPICPHTTSRYSILVPTDVKLFVTVEVRGKGNVAVDGKNLTPFETKMDFEISKGDGCLSFVKMDGQSFYSKLVKKLSCQG